VQVFRLSEDAVASDLAVDVRGVVKRSLQEVEVLAAMRAELLVLRKWPAVWALLMVPPLVALAFSYLSSFAMYLTLTPAQYAQLGSPAQDLPSMLPAQFVIAATQQFGTSGVVAFAVLGAMLAGGDWSRGTIRTSLMQGPGRVRTLAGQVAALTVAAAASVAVTFLLCAAASLVIARIEVSSVISPDGSLPGAWMITRGLGADLLIALAYATFGLALGTICRSAAGAIAATLLWTVIIEDSLYNMATQAGGLFLQIANFEPGSTAETLTFVFYKATGSAIWLPMSLPRAAWTLAGWIVAFLAVTAVLVHHRDIADKPRSPRRARLARSARLTLSPFRRALARRPHPGWAAGVLASLRAELLVMRRRPAVWLLLLVLPVNMLLSVYVTGYVYLRTAIHGLTLGVDPQQVLSAMSPGQYLSAPLTMLGPLSDSYGPTIFVVIGALIAGSDWGRGTIRTTLLAGPGRLQARIGQDLAVLLAAAVSVAATFGLAAAASAVVAATHGQQLAPGTASFPSTSHFAGAVAGALLLTLSYTAIGLALGTLLRSDTAAMGLAVLWAVIVAVNLLDEVPSWRGLPLALYKLLPDASVNTISNLYNNVLPGTDGSPIPPPYGVQVMPATAILTLSLYLIAALAVTAVITRRRDIT
jgi:ABC-type transport system involved in multi-copper enzyme maturation permease subunit